MMESKFLKEKLKSLAVFQKKHTIMILVIAMIITSINLYQMTKISMQSNLEEQMPKLDMDKVDDRIEDKFWAQDVILILVRLDKTSDEVTAPTDIRDPRVIDFMVNLGKRLSEEKSIDQVVSMGTVFEKTGVPDDLDTAKEILSKAGMEDLFNRDYSATLIYITCDLGTGEETLKELNSLAQEDIEISGIPPGVKATITGTPPMRDMILNLLQHDALYTLAIAAVLILVLLALSQGSFAKGIIVFIPLAMGIIWTLGIMASFGIQLSIATVGIGAMILGLAVEFGIFLVERYFEEREKYDQEETLKVTVSEVGYSIIGTGTAATIGFLALVISIAPMLGELGFSLALGIFLCLIVNLLITPAFIIAEENFEKWFTEYRHKRHSEKLIMHNNKKW
jgi:uncharacterized protein